MMPAKSDPFLAQFPEGGRRALGDEIRTHPVPDDQDHVPVAGGWLGFAGESGGKEAGQQREQERRFHFLEGEGKRPTSNPPPQATADRLLYVQRPMVYL